MARQPQQEKRDPKLSRSRMEEVIRKGGSVIFNGQVIENVDELPDDEELADTPEEKLAASADLQLQLRSIQARLDALHASGPAPAVNPTVTTGVSDPVDKDAAEKDAKDRKDEDDKAAKRAAVLTPPASDKK